jgi:hypothetical protein
MHVSLRTLIAAFGLVAGPLVAQEENEEPRPKWRVHVELHVVRLGEKKAFGLLPELRDEKKIQGAWQKLEKMIAAGEAKLEASPGGVTEDGDSIKVWEGEEVKYPIEFEQPQLMDWTEEQKRAVEKEGGVKVAANAGVSFAATTFETRNVGLEFSGVVSASRDGKWVEVESETNRVWLKQWDDFEAGRLANNEKILIKQPRFSSVKAQMQLRLESGERMLLSVHRVPGTKEEMELILLRVWTVREGGEK